MAPIPSGHKPVDPPSLTGGVGVTLRTGKEVIGQLPGPDYAVLLAAGLDTFRETCDWKLEHSIGLQLDALKERAATKDEHGGEPVVYARGGETFHVLPHGLKGGVRWVLTNDDFSIQLRNPTTSNAVTIEYRSAGLWEHGLSALRARAFGWLHTVAHASPDEPTLNRMDHAWDFHSPAFTAEMVPEMIRAVVCHSSVNKRVNGKLPVGYELWGHRNNVQTMTLGSKAGVQVQIYNKADEIAEKLNGKAWMLDVYRRVSGVDPADLGEDRPRDIWRIEVRFGKDWLKERNIRTVEHGREVLVPLAIEALATRRLTVPQGENRGRWPLHPMWALALDAAANGRMGEVAMVPLGRRVTGVREELTQRLIKQAGATLRAATVLREHGDFDQDTFEALARDALAAVADDRRHTRKVADLRERYELVDEAR